MALSAEGGWLPDRGLQDGRQLYLRSRNNNDFALRYPTIARVTPNHLVEQAVTLMLANSISQLPVMQGERDIKGVLTWETIGARFALGKSGREVREFMTSAQVIGFDRPLFEAIATIAEHQYVLVQAADKYFWNRDVGRSQSAISTIDGAVSSSQ